MLLEIPAGIGILVIVACFASESSTLYLLGFVVLALVISIGLLMFFRSLSMDREG